MAAAQQTEALPRTGPSLIVQIAVLLVMTGVAVGIGWFSGGMLGGQAKPDAGTVETEAADHAAPAEGGHGGGDAKEAGGHGEEGEKAGASPIVALEPITTNLAAPNEIWVRMELSVVFDTPPQDPAIADTIHQDLLGFMRTVKMHQIDGPSGFQHLKADLEERASIRSGGAAKKVLIRTLLFE